MPTKRKTNSAVCDLNGKAENKSELGWGDINTPNSGLVVGET